MGNTTIITGQLEFKNNSGKIPIPFDPSKNQKAVAQIGIQVPYRGPALNIQTKVTEVNDLSSETLKKYNDGDIISYNEEHYKVVYNDGKLVPVPDNELSGGYEIPSNEDINNPNAIFYSEDRNGYCVWNADWGNEPERTKNFKQSSDLSKLYFDEDRTPGFLDNDNFCIGEKISKPSSTKSYELTSFNKNPNKKTFKEDTLYHTINVIDDSDEQDSDKLFNIENSTIKGNLTSKNNKRDINDVEKTVELTSYKVQKNDPDGLLYEPVKSHNLKINPFISNDSISEFFQDGDKPAPKDVGFDGENYYDLQQITFNIEECKTVDVDKDHLFKGALLEDTPREKFDIYSKDEEAKAYPYIRISPNETDSENEPPFNFKVGRQEPGIELAIYKDIDNIPDTGVEKDSKAIEHIGNTATVWNIVANKTRLGKDITATLSQDNRGPYYLMSTNAYTVGDNSVRSAVERSLFGKDFFKYFNENEGNTPLLTAPVAVVDKKYDSTLVATAELKKAYKHPVNQISPAASYWMSYDLRNTDYDKNKESYCVVNLAGGIEGANEEERENAFKNELDSTAGNLESKDIKVFNVLSSGKDKLFSELEHAGGEVRVYLNSSDNKYIDEYGRENSYYEPEVFKQLYAESSPLGDKKGAYFTTETQDEFSEHPHEGITILDRIPVGGMETIVHPLVRNVYPEWQQSDNIQNEDYNIAEIVQSLCNELWTEGYLDISPEGVNSLQYSTLQDGDKDINKIVQGKIEDEGAIPYTLREGDIDTKYKRWTITVNEKPRVVHVFWPNLKNNKYNKNNIEALGGNSSGPDFDTGKFKRNCLDKLAKQGVFGNNDYICVLGICSVDNLFTRAAENQEIKLRLGQRIPAGGATHLGITGHDITTHVDWNKGEREDVNAFAHVSETDFVSTDGRGKPKSLDGINSFDEIKTNENWGNPYANDTGEIGNYEPLYKINCLRNADGKVLIRYYDYTTKEIDPEQLSMEHLNEWLLVEEGDDKYYFRRFKQKVVTDEETSTSSIRITEETNEYNELENGKFVCRSIPKDEIKNKEIEQQYHQCYWWWTSAAEDVEIQKIPAADPHYYEDGEEVSSVHGYRERVFPSIGDTSLFYLRQLDCTQPYLDINIETYYKVKLNLPDYIDGYLTQIDDLATINTLKENGNAIECPSYEKAKEYVKDTSSEELKDYIYVYDTETFFATNKKQRCYFLPYSNGEQHPQCELLSPKDIHLWYFYDKNDPLLSNITKDLYLSDGEYETYYKNCKIVTKMPYGSTYHSLYSSNNNKNSHEDLYSRLLAAYELENGVIKSKARTEESSPESDYTAGPYDFEKRYWIVESLEKCDADFFAMIDSEDYIKERVLIKRGGSNIYDVYIIEELDSDDAIELKYRKAFETEEGATSTVPITYEKYEKMVNDKNQEENSTFFYVYGDTNDLKNGLYRKANNIKLKITPAQNEAMAFSYGGDKDGCKEVGSAEQFIKVWDEEPNGNGESFRYKYVSINNKESEFKVEGTYGLVSGKSISDVYADIILQISQGGNTDSSISYYIASPGRLYKKTDSVTEGLWTKDGEKLLPTVDDSRIYVGGEEDDDFVVVDGSVNDNKIVVNNIPYCFVGNNNEYYYNTQIDSETSSYRKDEKSTDSDTENTYVVAITKIDLNKLTSGATSIYKATITKNIEYQFNNNEFKKINDDNKNLAPAGKLFTKEEENSDTVTVEEYPKNSGGNPKEMLGNDNVFIDISNEKFEITQNSSEETRFSDIQKPGETVQIYDSSKKYKILEQDGKKILFEYTPIKQDGIPTAEPTCVTQYSDGENEIFGYSAGAYEVSINNEEYYITQREILEFETNESPITITLNNGAYIPREVIVDYVVKIFTIDEDSDDIQGDIPVKTDQIESLPVEIETWV